MSDLVCHADNLMKVALKENVDQVEVVINKSHIGLARFKDKAIHQNIEGFRPLGPPHNNYSVKLRIIKNKKIGIVTASTINKTNLIIDALKSARYGKEYDTFTPPNKTPRLSGLYHKDTAYLEPEVRIEAINSIVNHCKDSHKNIVAVGGLLSNMESKTIILNSLGLHATHEFTGSQVILTAVAKENGKEGSGYQRQSSRDFYELDLKKVAEEKDF